MNYNEIAQTHPGLSGWNILSCYRGSIAHGMYLKPSNPVSVDDKDVMAICVPPPEYYMGLKRYGPRGKGTKEIKRYEWDIVIYEAKKAIWLLLKGNPNVLSLPWLESEFYINLTPAGRLLLENRDLFVGKHVYKSFTGYAYSQLKRMERYSFNGYMGKKRKALVDRLGYDAKNAAHLIRLLRMGIEFLETGRLLVKRPDANELLQVKRGEWTLTRIKDEAEKLFRKAEDAYELSTLPEKPDKDKVSRLCMAIVTTAHKAQHE